MAFRIIFSLIVLMLHTIATCDAAATNEAIRVHNLASAISHWKQLNCIFPDKSLYTKSESNSSPILEVCQSNETLNDTFRSKLCNFFYIVSLSYCQNQYNSYTKRCLSPDALRKFNPFGDASVGKDVCSYVNSSLDGVAYVDFMRNKEKCQHVCGDSGGGSMKDICELYVMVFHQGRHKQDCLSSSVPSDDTKVAKASGTHISESRIATAHESTAKETMTEKDQATGENAEEGGKREGHSDVPLTSKKNGTISHASKESAKISTTPDESILVTQLPAVNTTVIKPPETSKPVTQPPEIGTHVTQPPATSTPLSKALDNSTPVAETDVGVLPPDIESDVNQEEGLETSTRPTETETEQQSLLPSDNLKSTKPPPLDKQTTSPTKPVMLDRTMPLIPQGNNPAKGDISDSYDSEEDDEGMHQQDEDGNDFDSELPVNNVDNNDLLTSTISPKNKSVQVQKEDEEEETVDETAGKLSNYGGSNEDESPGSGHFLAYFLTAVVICISGYIIYHNKQKIMAFIIEGRKTGRGGRQRSKDVKYTQLKSSVEEVMPSLEQTAATKNFVY